MVDSSNSTHGSAHWTQVVQQLQADKALDLATFQGAADGCQLLVFMVGSWLDRSWVGHTNSW